MKRALLSVLLLAVACSSGSTPQPGPQDAGSTEDSGTDSGSDDAGGTEDSGTDGGSDDAGSTEDAGTADAGDDAGTTGDAGTDAGSGNDAGTDAGTADAGTCAAPAEQPGTDLATRLNTPRRLAVDATDVYISESHSLNPQQPTPGEGQVLKLSRSGGTATPFATGFRAPDAIAVDATSVYVLDLDGLWRVDKATGKRGDLPIDTTLNNVTVGGTEVLPATLSGRDVLVVATGTRWLIRVDTDGSNRQALYTSPSGGQVRSARVVGPDVWFLVAGGTLPGIYRVPLDGNTASARYFATATQVTSLEVTPTHFLLTEGGGGTGRVLKQPRDGGTAEVLATGLQGPLFPVELGGTVYFKDSRAGSTDFLRSVRTCAPGTSDPVGPSGTGPGGLIVDGNTLLYTSQESGTGGAVGRVP
ncbi:signal integration modulator SinM [Pyxidicoccus parkwayensis]|uniref:Signal integration modulator SinM n=1 Tax=Pyxidicoccus parkwayensis TaxID=2813578 RepID=A0ABX7P430_9BACT|nr:signal integration modulator SinM [Pyxidicoccus parkwaysis]QSQ25201.1 signal integration modulator SinM [Pyxidicoccus parkwaysis]